MERIFGAYLALIVAGFTGQLLVWSLAVFVPISLAPWLAFQLLLMPVAACLGWFFPNWVWIFSSSVKEHIRNSHHRSHGLPPIQPDNESLDGLPKEFVDRLRAEIRGQSD